MTIHVRRIQLEPQTGRGDLAYVFFESGQFAKPLFILSQFDAEGLLDELETQLTEEGDDK
jgi:hypothetical protein